MANDELVMTQRAADLRQRAERALHHVVDDEQALQLPRNVNNLIHELQVHQIELEMQNEELRQTQVELSESRDQYSELYDSAPVGYMTIDHNGRIAQTNLTSALLLGVPRAALSNQLLADFVYIEDQDLLYHHRRHIFAAPETLHTVELRLTRAATGPFYAQLASRAIRGLPGQITHYRTIVSDITVRKQSEADLLANNQLLTATLAALHSAQATLVQQERLAAVGQLSAGIAHDFNNILMIISSYTDLLLQQSPLVPNASTKLHIIKAQAAGAARLVQQILDFSRQSMMVRTPIDLHHFLADIATVLASTLADNIQLVIQPCVEASLISADRTQLQQVLINLIHNARDAMPAGGTITIKLANLDITTPESATSTVVGPGTWAIIMVTDSGPGIPPEVIPHLFEPFFTTRAPHGSGLGLAQAHGIIKQHGGEIEVVTQLGKGTSFKLYLPRLVPVVIPAAPEPVVAPIEPTVAYEGSQGKGETILVVDDNEIVVQMLTELLEIIGYHVFSVTDGAAALECYQQYRNQIALVLTDLTMPRMSGIELTNALRTLNPQVKVIISTGYQSNFVIKSQLNRGAVTWLQKPIELDLLQQTVADLIAAR